MHSGLAVSATLLDYTHRTYHLRELDFWNVHMKDLWRKIAQSRHMSSLSLSEIWYKHGSLRFQKCFHEVVNDTVSLCFKNSLVNMEIWDARIASGCFDLPKLSADWFKKKIAFWVRVSFWVQDYHGAQTVLELKETMYPRLALNS